MRRRAGGFTLLEMIAVVTILGILAAIAVPNMGAMIRTQHVKTASFDVFATLVLARSEAIKRNVSVTVTPTGGNWTNGWTVTDAFANTLRQQAAYNNVMIAGPGTVVYTSSGRLSAVAMPQFNVSASNVSASNLRCIKVDLSGRPVSYEGACS